MGSGGSTARAAAESAASKDSARNQSDPSRRMTMSALRRSSTVSALAAIIAYAWSRDGKKIAITRSRYNDQDVVMFSGFR